MNAISVYTSLGYAIYIDHSEFQNLFVLLTSFNSVLKDRYQNAEEVLKQRYYFKYIFIIILWLARRFSGNPEELLTWYLTLIGLFRRSNFVI